MPSDPARTEETRAWFERAKEDLRAARFELTASPPLTTDIVFHAQQTAEKAMKGFLLWHNKIFRKTHNLVELGEQCTAIEPALETLLHRAAPLTEYAWKFRYPGENESPDVGEATESLDLAQEVYDGLLRLLPDEVRP